MRAVILAGGLGTRLRTCVPNLPKVMAPVNKRPFLEYLLERLESGGIHHVVLSVGYKAEVIQEHFGNRYHSISLRYAIEKEPLGTGGAAAYATADLGEDPVLVLNGDTYLAIDYADLTKWFYAAEPLPEMGMVLRRVDDTARYGAVASQDGKVTGFSEKTASGPGLINAGIYLLRPALFTKLGLKGRFSIETDLLKRYYQQLDIRAYETGAYFIDMGVPEDYTRAQKEFEKLSASNTF